MVHLVYLGQLTSADLGGSAFVGHHTGCILVIGLSPVARVVFSVQLRYDSVVCAEGSVWFSMEGAAAVCACCCVAHSSMSMHSPCQVLPSTRDPGAPSPGRAELRRLGPRLCLEGTRTGSLCLTFGLPVEVGLDPSTQLRYQQALVPVRRFVVEPIAGLW